MFFSLSFPCHVFFPLKNLFPLFLLIPMLDTFDYFVSNCKVRASPGRPVANRMFSPPHCPNNNKRFVQPSPLKFLPTSQL